MLFGPRRWIYQNSQPKKSFSVHDNQFHWKYIFTFSSIIFIGFVVSCLPILIFINRNYTLFEKIAYDRFPSLISNLNQEIHWMWIMFTLSCVLVTLFTVYFANKFTLKILNPVRHIESHLQKVMYGNWQDPIEFEDDKQDLKSLKTNYDYFYRSLKTLTEMELDLLRRINVDPNNRDSFLAWKNLVETKAQRIGHNLDEYINSLSTVSKDHQLTNFTKEDKKNGTKVNLKKVI